MRWVLLLLVLFGCAAETVSYSYVGEDSWNTPGLIPLQLRASKFDSPNTITAVPQPPTAEAPSGPAQAGTRLPVTLDGVACEVNVLGRTTFTVDKSPTKSDHRVPRASGTREVRGLDVRIDCGGQPIPGTDASYRGAHSRTGTLWAALFLALGIAAGALANKDKIGAAVLVGAVALVGGLVFGLMVFESVFRVTYALLFVGHGLAGIIAMRGDAISFRIITLAGVVIGTAIAPLLWPVWTGFGPICAILFGAGVGVIGMVGVVLKEG